MKKTAFWVNFASSVSLWTRSTTSAASSKLIQPRRLLTRPVGCGALGAHRSTFRRQMDKTVAQKQSRVPAAHASQQSSDSSFHLEKGLKKAKITPKCILGTRKWPIFDRFRPFSEPQNCSRNSFDLNEQKSSQDSIPQDYSLGATFFD